MLPNRIANAVGELYVARIVKPETEDLLMMCRAQASVTLDTIPIDCQRPLLTGDQYGAACDQLNYRMLLNCS